MKPPTDSMNALPTPTGPVRTAPAVRRKRAHPARRTRRFAGATDVVGMVVMTGYMSLNAGASSAQPNTFAPVTASTSNTTVNRSTTVATAATPAAAAHTTSASS